jgi:hypothetical protein
MTTNLSANVDDFEDGINKRFRNSNKKLREIEELEKKQESGTKLNEFQTRKLEEKDFVLGQIEELKNVKAFLGVQKNLQKEEEERINQEFNDKIQLLVGTFLLPVYINNTSGGEEQASSPKFPGLLPDTITKLSKLPQFLVSKSHNFLQALQQSISAVNNLLNSSSEVAYDNATYGDLNGYLSKLCCLPKNKKVIQKGSSPSSSSSSSSSSSYTSSSSSSNVKSASGLASDDLPSTPVSPPVSSRKNRGKRSKNKNMYKISPIRTSSVLSSGAYGSFSNSNLDEDDFQVVERKRRETGFGSKKEGRNEEGGDWDDRKSRPRGVFIKTSGENNQVRERDKDRGRERRISHPQNPDFVYYGPGHEPK